MRTSNPTTSPPGDLGDSLVTAIVDATTAVLEEVGLEGLQLRAVAAGLVYR